MKTVIMILMLVSCTAEAQWTCTYTSIQKSGPDYEACGVGYGVDENKARDEAFREAKGEFTRLYELDDSIRGHAVTVTPNRTDCQKEQDGRYKCFRSISFLIQKEMRERPIASPDKFESYVYSESEHSKLYVGMKKSELLDKFGKPEKVEKGISYMRYEYVGKLCQDRSIFTPCVVLVDEDSVVQSWDKINLDYTTDLK